MSIIKNKPVLIIEKNQSGLKLNENMYNKSKEFRLGGIFTEFDVMNRNERIYTAQKFLPHLNELIERKNTLGVIYGEYDHPDVFDTSLQRASHTLEKIYYNQEKNRVDGEIKLLDNHWGKEAQAIVKGGNPIFVSSRAAGVTESDGTVSVKKLFTYDAVADPGFGSAKMQVLNESLGFQNNTNFRIYDISDESKINELFNMNKNDEKTKQQFEEYVDYLSEELVKVKQQLQDIVKEGKADVNQVDKYAELYDNLVEQQNKVNQYLEYLSEKMVTLIDDNKSLKTRTKKLVEHNDYLAETLEKTINYSNYLAENLDKNISYSEYIAETLDKNIDFSEYIAEHVSKTIEFSDYLAENLEQGINYAEYIAENLDQNIAYSEYIAEHVDNNISYSEYLAENLDKNIAYAEYLAENLDNNIAYAEYIAEHVDNNIAYAEYIAEHVDNNIAYSEYIAENVSDTKAYMNYIAEGLDKTISAVKNNKLFEQEGQAQIPDMTDVDVQSYYEDDDDFVQKPVQTQSQVQLDDQGQPVQTQPVQGEPVQGEPVQGEPVQGEPVQGEPVQGQPVQGEPVQGEPVQGEPVQGQPVQGEFISVQGEPIQSEMEFVPGMTVSVNLDTEDRTGEILASNPETNIVVLKMTDNEELVEVHESKITIIPNKILETEQSLKNHIGQLITETKKRKASENNEPDFIQFLTEKNKKHWYDLSKEDKEKVIFSINESGEQIYSEGQLLNAISEALTVKKSFEDILLENMPSTLKPIWSKIDEKYQKSILSSANLYPNLDNEVKIEKFWESRNLESYTQINESKKVLNKNNFVDNTSLSDDEIDRFISRIKNL